MQTIIICWEGPYNRNQVAETEKGRGLYLLVGKLKGQKKSRVQYFGITERLYNQRFCDKGHKINDVTEDSLQIWLGQILYPDKYDRSLLEKAEHCLVYIWESEANIRKKNYRPQDPICVISQWYKPGGEVARKNHPPKLNLIPDTLWWDGKRWRSGFLKVWDEEYQQ